MSTSKRSASAPAPKSLGLRVAQLLILTVIVAFVGAELFLTSPQSVLRFQYGGQPITQSTYERLGQAPWEAHTLSLLDGTSLRGLMRRPESETAPWFLYFGGNSDQYLLGAQTFLEAVAGGQDVGLASYAYRGFDGSEGELDSDTLKIDAVEIYDSLRRNLGLEDRAIHLVGFSLGTHAVLSVAKELTKRGARPGSTTLLAPFTTIDISAPGPLNRWYPADHYDSLSLLSEIELPIMVIHGDADGVLPIEQSQQIVTELGDNAGFVRVAGAGHGDLVGRSEVHALVREVVAPAEFHETEAGEVVE